MSNPMTASEADSTSRRFAHVRFGVAGWSYPDWRGVVYPSKRPRGFSELRYLAELVDTIEINCTFYRPVDERTSARWAETVLDLTRFSFTVKAPKALTHVQEASRDETKAIASELRGGVTPLAQAGKLGGVLLQFPWYFEDRPQNRVHLQRSIECLEPLPVFVEVRHQSFIDGTADGALRFFERLGANLVNVDMPDSSTSPGLCSINTGPLGYFRLHGRNAVAWFDPKSGRDAKYDYLYSHSELDAIAERISRVASRTTTAYVITNNHFRGQAVGNALQLMKLFGRPSSLPGNLATALGWSTATDTVSSALPMRAAVTSHEPDSSSIDPLEPHP